MNYVIQAALFLHILSAVVWVGGMFFAHFCLRPAMSDVSPQLRLPLWEAVFARFFVWITVAIVVLLATGGYLMSHFGGAQAPWPVMAMAGVGVLMMLIFGHIRFALYPRLRRAVQSQKWPDGARAIGGIRMMVTINLVLGIVTIGLGVLGII